MGSKNMHDFKNNIVLEKTYRRIAFAVLMMPFTLIRFGYVGYGEIFFLLFFLSELLKKKHDLLKRNFVFSKFWLFFLIISLIGFLYNFFILNNKTGTIGGAIFDFSSYVVVFISLYALENFIYKKEINILYLLEKIFFYSSIAFITLFLISRYSDTLFGYKLFYWDRFAPLSNNPHQMSIYLSPLPFLGILLLNKRKSLLRKVIIIIFILFLVYFIFNTESFKGIMGLYLSVFVFLGLTIFKYIKKKQRIFLLILLGLLFILPIILFIGTLTSYGVEYFSENDYEGGRLYLYKEAIEIIKTSPIIGHGAGGHVWSPKQEVFADSHQTFLTIIIQAGITGLLLFLVFLNKILKVYLKNAYIMAALIPVFMYLLGGDILRKLPTWIMLLLFYYYLNEKKESDKIKDVKII